MEFLLKIPFQKEHRVASDSSQSNFSIMPHHGKKKTTIKLFRGLLITLAAALSGTASGTSVASASASLRDRSHSQRVLSWFQHVSSNGMHCHWPWHLSSCNTPRTAEAHVICSSLLLSWCFSFCNVFRRRYLAMSVRNPTSSWISWDQHTSLYKNPSSQVSRAIFSHVHTTNQRTHRMERDTARSKIK